MPARRAAIATPAAGLADLLFTTEATKLSPDAADSPHGQGTSALTGNRFDSEGRARSLRGFRRLAPYAEMAAGEGGFSKAYRVMLRPRPGFYVMRLKRGAPLVPALIYQFCPMVVPQLTALGDPHPEDWCRPLDRSPHYGAQIDGRRVEYERVWFSRSLRPISIQEYGFRMGALRRWAGADPGMPEARPERSVNLAALPPLF